MKKIESILTTLKSGIKVCLSKYLNKKYPVFLVFELTYRCNQRCCYCNRFDGHGYNEASTDIICRIISEAKQLGLIRVYLTGGEPLLRQDIGEIIRYCEELGIMVELWTNGSLISDKENILDFVDSITLSVDGAEKTHELIRGEGTFLKIVEAAKIARRHNVYVSLNYTITSKNLHGMRGAAAVAQRLGATIGFQPITELFNCKNDIYSLMPTTAQFQEALKEITVLKKDQPHVVENSMASLEYLRTWPELKPFACMHGKVIFTVLPNAKMVVCTNSKIADTCSVDLKNTSLNDAIKKIADFQCGYCGCYGAYDSSGSGTALPLNFEVTKSQIFGKWFGKTGSSA